MLDLEGSGVEKRARLPHSDTMFARTLILIVAFICAAPLSAAPMDAAAFDAYTKGKTLYFMEGGEKYGAERYLPGRRVEWSFLDGKCKQGEWYQDGRAICFVYEDNPEPQCWEFEQTPRGLKATFLNTAQSTELYEASQSDEPLYCMGPDVGA